VGWLFKTFHQDSDGAILTNFDTGYVASHLYEWHDSFLHVHALCHMDPCVCDMTHIHTCDTSHSYVRHDSFIFPTWLISDMTHLYVQHDSFTKLLALLPLRLLWRMKFSIFFSYFFFWHSCIPFFFFFWHSCISCNDTHDYIIQFTFSKWFSVWFTQYTELCNLIHILYIYSNTHTLYDLMYD